MSIFGTVVDIAVADLVEGLGGAQPLPLFWVKKKKKKKESQKEEKPVRQSDKNRAPSSAQGLDPPSNSFILSSKLWRIRDDRLSIALLWSEILCFMRLWLA